jgi:two-component system cell cycle sensor histidine kinase/response regulator CckA
MSDRFAELIRGLHVGVVVQGPSTEVLLCNPAALELLGLDEAQYTGKTSYDPDWNIIREDGSPFLAEQRPMAKVLATGQPVRNVVMGVFRPKTRDRVWLLVNAEPQHDAEGRIVQIVATLIDITERRRLEASLAEARKLESIGRLAGGVAHDFNNLLTVITGATSLALGLLPEGSPAQSELELTLEAAARATALTRQLLLFARKRTSAAQTVDVGQTLRELEPLIRRVLGVGIALRLECATTGLTKIDPVELEQVLMNLVGNARDAMPDGGELTIRCEQVVVAPTTADEERARWVRLTVADCGAGMEPATLERIFDPFFTTKEPGRGTGLGLATVHGIVSHAGGRISVQSQPGRGTTFVIELPAEAARPSAAATDARDAPGGRETILLVEDEDVLRRLGARILRELGYTVHLAADGRQALSVAEQHGASIDLLLTDLTMPVLGGAALAREFVERWPRAKVMVMSGFADAARGVRETFAVLDKPYTPRQLGERVREVLDGVSARPND